MKHHHSHIALLMIALSITIFVCALYGYMQFAIGSSLDRALAAREAVKNEQVYKSQKQNLNTLYNDTASSRAKLGSFFVADDQKVAFIEKIESLDVATGAKITLSNIVADDLATSPVGTLGRVSLRVDASGSWSSVMRVLRLVETLPYKTTVSAVRVDVVAGDSKSAHTEWRVTFALDSISIRRQL
jgi:anaerobic C4-dicarboxylate transporter